MARARFIMPPLLSIPTARVHVPYEAIRRTTQPFPHPTSRKENCPLQSMASKNVWTLCRWPSASF